MDQCSEFSRRGAMYQIVVLASILASSSRFSSRSARMSGWGKKRLSSKRPGSRQTLLALVTTAIDLERRPVALSTRP